MRAASRILGTLSIATSLVGDLRAPRLALAADSASLDALRNGQEVVRSRPPFVSPPVTPQATASEINSLLLQPSASTITEVVARDIVASHLTNNREYNFLVDLFISYDRQGAFVGPRARLESAAEFNTYGFLVERAREGARTGLILPSPDKADLVSAAQKISGYWYDGVTVFLPPFGNAGVLADDRLGNKEQNVRSFFSKDWILHPRPENLDSDQKVKEGSLRERYKALSASTLANISKGYINSEPAGALENRVNYVVRAAIDSPEKKAVLEQSLGIKIPDNDKAAYSTIFTDPAYRKFKPFIESTEAYAKNPNNVDARERVEKEAVNLQMGAYMPFKNALAGLKQKPHFDFSDTTPSPSKGSNVTDTAYVLPNSIKVVIASRELAATTDICAIMVRHSNPILASRLESFGEGARQIGEGLYKLSLGERSDRSPMEVIGGIAKGVEKVVGALFGAKDVGAERHRQLLQAISLVREEVHDVALQLGFVRRDLWTTTQQVNARLDEVFSAISALDERLTSCFHGIEDQLKDQNRRITEIDYKVSWLGYDVGKGFALEAAEWAEDERRPFDTAYFQVFLSRSKINGQPIQFPDFKIKEYADIFARHAIHGAKNSLLSGEVLAMEDLIRERAWMRPTQYTFGFIPVLLERIGVTNNIPNAIANPMDFMRAADAYLRFRGQYSTYYSDDPALLAEMIQTAQSIEKISEIISAPQTLLAAYDLYETKIKLLKQEIERKCDFFTKIPNTIENGKFMWFENRARILTRIEKPLKEGEKAKPGAGPYGFEQEIKINTKGEKMKLPVDLDPPLLPSDVRVALAMQIAEGYPSLVILGNFLTPELRELIEEHSRKGDERTTRYFRADRDYFNGRISQKEMQRIQAAAFNGGKDHDNELRDLLSRFSAENSTNRVILTYALKFNKEVAPGGTNTILALKREFGSAPPEWFKSNHTHCKQEVKDLVRLNDRAGTVFTDLRRPVTDPDWVCHPRGPFGNQMSLPDICNYWVGNFEKWKTGLFKPNNRATHLARGLERVDGLSYDDWFRARIATPRKTLREVFNELAESDVTVARSAEALAQQAVRTWIDHEKLKLTTQIFESLRPSNDTYEAALSDAIAAAEILHYIAVLGWGDRLDIKALRLFRSKDILSGVLANGALEDPSRLCERLENMLHSLEAVKASIDKVKNEPKSREIVPGLAVLTDRLRAAHAVAQEKEVKELKVQSGASSK